MIRSFTHLALLALVLLLPACALSLYKPPVIDVPQHAIGETGDVSGWWKSFNDKALDALVNEALANNADIRTAAARLEQAQMSLRLAQSSLFPSLDFQPGVSRSKTSEAGNIPPIAGQARISTLHTAQFTTSYEVDLWGRLASLRSDARAGKKATAYQQEAMRNLVVAEVARSYFTLRTLERDEYLLNQVLGTREKAVKVQKERFKVGLMNAYEFALVEADLNAVAAALPQARTAREQAEIGLAALVGRSPQELTDLKMTRGNSLEALAKAKEIPAGLPSDLLQRRPDVKAAEQLLLSADAKVSEARAKWFPLISLTGFLGGESADLSDIVSEAARTWNIAALATQPIIGLWTTKSRVARAKAAREEAEIAYQQAARQAYADILTALSRHKAAKESLAQAQKLYANQSKVRDLAGQQLKTGQVGQLNVLDAEREKLTAGRSLISARRERLIALVGVYQALGGGW